MQVCGLRVALSAAQNPTVTFYGVSTGAGSSPTGTLLIFALSATPSLRSVVADAQPSQ
jgi:hypothetical protein